MNRDEETEQQARTRRSRLMFLASMLLLTAALMSDPTPRRTASPRTQDTSEDPEVLAQLPACAP